MAYDAIYEFIQECFVGKKKENKKKKIFYIIFYFTYETIIEKFLAEVFQDTKTNAALIMGHLRISTKKSTIQKILN